MSDIENIEPEKKGISRRTVTKAMAWAVPVIAIAAPVPAFAASGGPPNVAVGTACKLPGKSANAQGCDEVFAGLPGLDTDNAYAIPLLVCNNTDKPIVLQPDITITTTSGDLEFTVVGISPDYCTPIAPCAGVICTPGECVKVIIYANTNDSANTEVTFDVTVPWGHDCTDPDHPPIVIEDVVVDDFPPCSSRTPFPQGSPTCDPPFYDATPTP